MVETIAIAALKSKTTASTSDVYYTTDKNKQGSWYYDNTDTTSTDNTGTILESNTGGLRFKRIFNGYVDIRWFGAIGDGVADDRVAIEKALAANSSILIPPGVFNVSTMTFGIDNQVQFAQGGRILVAAGHTVTWGSVILAGLDQWIFDCASDSSNPLPTNYSTDVPSMIRTKIPLRFHHTVELSRGFTSFVSVKWFGATGAGFKKYNAVGTDNSATPEDERKSDFIDRWYDDQSDVITTTDYVDDTKALRFALTAVAASTSSGNPSASQAYCGSNTLYFPRGCYIHKETLYVSAGTILRGDGATPSGGSVLFNLDPRKTQMVLQADGFGGIGGSGSAHILRDLIFQTRATTIKNQNSYVIKFEDNVLNFDSRFYNLRFSNCPLEGAIFYANKKEKRLTAIPDDNLSISFHLYDSMIDVCQGDFIRMGEYSTSQIRVYNTQFFDVWQQVVNVGVKLNTVPFSLFEFNSCNFYGCGISGISTYANGYPFVYLNDLHSDFFMRNCLFDSATIEDRYTGGRFLITSL